jgi:hypothetical protein
MKPRTIRRLVVAGLAAAAIALGIFGTNAVSSAGDIEWTQQVNDSVIR